MKIVFVSNFFNHHQQPLSEALFRHTGGQYYFVATTPIPRDRVKLGYGMEQMPPYVLCAYADEAQKVKARRLIDEADVVIAGSAPEAMLRDRLRAGKLMFRYSERPLKKGFSLLKFLPRILIWNWRNPPGKPIYMLCASAFTASDYAKFGLFRNRCYKWGYFPETKCYEAGALMDTKNEKALLWAGRFIDWKHPDDAVEVARRLRRDGYDFTLTMIGCGAMERAIRERIAELDLDDHVFLTGSMKPEEVREYMERSGIFMFTSDRKEGWGAVLNESMNSGCAVIGCEAIGSVPYLIRDGENGLIYKSGNVDELYEKAKYLLDHPKEQYRLGLAAYRTISELWNAETAADRLVELCVKLLNGEKRPDICSEGPCSFS